CIRREVRAGRGSPHGGVFLDIAWIKEKIPNSAEHIKKKLPSMYHQFKQLADLDITKEPMEIGPTTHYFMGGIKVDGDSQMTTVPDCSPLANVPRACTAQTAWAGIRSRTCWCLASARASTPPDTPGRLRRQVRPRSETRSRRRLRARKRRSSAEPAVRIHLPCSTSCKR